MCGILQDKSKAGGSLGRVLVPLSSLSGWGLVAVGALMVMHVLGFNIQPLLTVGGVGGLAVGFGAQAVTSNAISGLNLFLTRPFVVGGTPTQALPALHASHALLLTPRPSQRRACRSGLSGGLLLLSGLPCKHDCSPGLMCCRQGGAQDAEREHGAAWNSGPDRGHAHHRAHGGGRPCRHSQQGRHGDDRLQ